ncbi:histone deacetylase [Vibrio navarrensis]|uniref:histone deacetylase family protein n=1 Tax=Vibrio navarrensis TaxID=29495 RepID=UPI0018684B25|nr:histone deacetylase [Vibrio navarrensis]MBE3654717.1 histone deacetylase [Vibrio navarrensis]
MLPLIYHPLYSDLPLPPEHRYPINKYRHLFAEINLQMAGSSHWQSNIRFYQPQALSLEDVKQIHCAHYVDLLASGQLPAAKMRRIGFPWSEHLIERTLTSAGGTVLTAQKALQHGLAIHLSGGYHHAHHDFGSGFCLFNDLVLAAHVALRQEGVDKVLIIDSDVHHGDGTATLCQQRDDIITLSLHCEKNFPARKPDSDFDVPLPRESDDDAFLAAFCEVVPMAIHLHRPDLILYDAGVDIHQQDELGYLNVSSEAIYQRDTFLLTLANELSIPLAAVVGGGYRTNHQDLVPIHMQLIHAAMSLK